MKRYYVDILQIVVGTVVGTLLVLGWEWFMFESRLGVCPPCLILGLIALFLVSMVFIGLKSGSKGVVVVIVSFILGWYGYFVRYKHRCEPNADDVMVMKSMGEKISTYITEHGIPALLKDIPNLPYDLKRCELETYYLVNGKKEKRISSEANYVVRQEICDFKDMILSLDLNRDMTSSMSNWWGHLNIRVDGGTRMYSFVTEDKDGFHFNKFSFDGSSTGVCTPWGKQ